MGKESTEAREGYAQRDAGYLAQLPGEGPNEEPFEGKTDGAS